MSTPASTPDIPLPEPAPPRKRVLWKWSLAVTAMVVAFFGWKIGSGFMTGASSADSAVEHFHEQLNAAQYQEIMQETGEGFRKGWTNQELLTFFKKIHETLGNAGPASRAGINVTALTTGTYVTVRYNTKFEKDDAVVETFTWLRAGDQMKLNGYNVSSKYLALH